MIVDETKYSNKQLWKRRIRNAPSAPRSESEIQLYVLWNGEGLPTAAQKRDSLLWAAWVLKTGLIYKVVFVRQPGATEYRYFSDEKEALAEYKRLSKTELPRSKDVDYGFPLVPDDTDEVP